MNDIFAQFEEKIGVKIDWQQIDDLVTSDAKERRSVPTQQKLPQTAAIVNLTDDEIIEMWLQPENFRTVEMNLKGNLREPALIKFLTQQKINVSKPTTPYPKFDVITENNIKIQIKGCSKNLCNLEKSIIGAEVMGTHGKGAIRCYQETDFDYLGLVIDPIYLPKSYGLTPKQYYFCFIPAHSLPLHYKNIEWNENNRLYPLCKFLIQKDENGVFLSPFTDYKVQVQYRNLTKIYLNRVPAHFSKS